MKKRYANARKTAEKLAAKVLKYLSQFSEEEQEERINRAERTVANTLLTPGVEIGTSLSARKLTATPAPKSFRPVDVPE